MPLFPQRGPSQGSRLFTNADLQDRPALGITVERDTPNVPVANPPQHQPGDRSIQALLREAQYSIGQSGYLLDDINGYDSSAENEALAESRDAGTITDSSTQHPVRDFTQALAKPAPALATAGLIGAFTPAAPLAAGMMGASEALAAPDILRRLIAPGRHESRGGAALEAGAYAMGPALKGLKGLGKSDVTARFVAEMDAAAEAKAAQEANTVRETVNTARDYRRAGATTEEAGQRAGWPLGKSEQTAVVNHAAPGYAPDPISEIMDGSGGAYTRKQNPMDALRKLHKPDAPVSGHFGRPVVPQAGPNVGRDEISAMRNALRQMSARSMNQGF